MAASDERKGEGEGSETTNHAVTLIMPPAAVTLDLSRDNPGGGAFISPEIGVYMRAPQIPRIPRESAEARFVALRPVRRRRSFPKERAYQAP